MPVVPGRSDTLAIVRPRIRVQGRVSRVPDGGAAELVGSRPCPDLNLRGTAPFHVHGGNDHADFVDHVRIDIRGRSQTLSMAPVIYGHAVQLHIHIGGAAGGNARKRSGRAAVSTNARHDRRKIHDVAPH